MTSRGLRGLLGLLLAGAGAAARAQDTVPPPFQPGERLEYTVRVSRMGASGHAAMWIEGPVLVRGIEAWLLRFETTAGIGPVKGADRTASWLDHRRMASLRFVKHERHLLSSHDDSVEILPEERRWTSWREGEGELSTATPLDELSFIYFLRTLPHADDSTRAFTRHFDPARNPTLLRRTSREVVETKAGAFETLVIEMRVRDPRHYRGEGTIRINLSDDARRLPVRIQSRMPVFGATVLTLESHTAAVAGTPPAR